MNRSFAAVTLNLLFGVPIVSPIALPKPVAATCDRQLNELHYLIDSKVVGEAGIEPTTPGLEERGVAAAPPGVTELSH